MTKGFRMAVPVLALALGAGGCFVTSSKFEAKTKEVDSLRDALAATNQEKNTLEGRYLAVQQQLSEEQETNAALSSQNREQTEELREVREELAQVIRKYEGTRLTREELIAELLEKEKATGKRIQDLCARAEACETEREGLQRTMDQQAAVLAELERKAAETPDIVTLRRERDILLGRVERFKEEQILEARRRDRRFAELARTFPGISPRITAAPIGPAIRVFVPDEILFRKGKPVLTDTGKKVVGEVGKTASEFPRAAILIKAKGKKQADTIQTTLTNGHSVKPERILVTAGSSDGKTELLMVVP